MNKEREQNDADVRKLENFWLESGLAAERKAADEKVKIAEDDTGRKRLPQKKRRNR